MALSGDHREGVGLPAGLPRRRYSSFLKFAPSEDLLPVELTAELDITNMPDLLEFEVPGLSISLPPNSVTESIVINVSAPVLAEQPETLLQAVQFDVQDKKNYKFERFVTIRIPYPEGNDSKRLAVSEYNADTNTWGPPLPGQMDITKKTVSADIEHFSIFGVFDLGPAPAPTTGGGHHPVTSMANELAWRKKQQQWVLDDDDEIIAVLSLALRMVTL